MRIFSITMLAAVMTTLFASKASALRFTDGSYEVPKGVVGKPYSHTFELAKGGGSPPYHYKIANGGKLPPGLTLGQEDGKVTGTPLAAGKWSVWLHGTDSGLQQGFWDMQTEREFTFDILSALSIREQEIGPAVHNKPYNTRLTADGGGTPVWSIESGKLPPGIGLKSDGTLSGTASAAGHFTFVVRVTDRSWDEYAAGTRKHMTGHRAETRTFVLWVAKVGIELPANGIPPMETGKPVASAKLTTIGGTAPCVWSVAGKTNLPAGLTLDAMQGIISGTPEMSGSFPLVILVKDASGAVGIVRTTLEIKTSGGKQQDSGK
jgi:hypothetical protein